MHIYIHKHRVIKVVPVQYIVAPFGYLIGLKVAKKKNLVEVKDRNEINRN